VELEQTAELEQIMPELAELAEQRLMFQMLQV
jgi:hypothetical protein